ncbi:hypothetical protein DVA86_29865 [Streptomyces armeniacus]|uniref:Lipoprotein n=1 Tax=Streptomyces armeniacus TaxID=83291 RepID=A0A345Y1J7_9ACTN|nr:hypothetical protein [Streptomyces armeniacus]AXK37763.1 hypothetical protein DVA86_29865 [Streptomyces armeniacus]
MCVGLSAALAGCGGEEPPKGTNGVDELSAAKIEKKARAAVQQAESVRLSGTIVSKGQTYRLEMRLKSSGGIGEVSSKGGDTFQLLRVDKDLYLKADSDFWAHQEKGDGEEPSKADVAAAGKLEGKYVKVPDEDPAYEQLSGFTEMRVMLDGLLVLDGERETGDHGEVGGTDTIEVRAGDGKGGTLEVSLSGTPYPLRLERGGSAGTVRLDDWNKGFAVRAPKKEQIVDYGKEISADG